MFVIICVNNLNDIFTELEFIDQDTVNELYQGCIHDRNYKPTQLNLDKEIAEAINKYTSKGFNLYIFESNSPFKLTYYANRKIYFKVINDDRST